MPAVMAGRSPSSRRAWIEINTGTRWAKLLCVALLAEGVDRNRNVTLGSIAIPVVALLAEGVDRNTDLGGDVDNAQKVALLAEGVDRNTTGAHTCTLIYRRPPRGGRG